MTAGMPARLEIAGFLVEEHAEAGETALVGCYYTSVST
ncbi:hypothetical protein H4W80_009398 [Nonomuraea angiospora]|uniref:Uncharacterized protein n=1 Tax=Nonomuraea angiospora TaxID=46172 RepID=A0ABR9MDZ7_9ACTN|nr:hypothetical protein [Nonomuraea angiospora]